MSTWLGMFKGLLTNLWIRDYPCFSILSTLLPFHCSLATQSTGGWIKREKVKWIWVPSVPDKHLHHKATCWKKQNMWSLSVGTEHQKSNSASIKLCSSLARWHWPHLAMPHFQSCFFHSNFLATVERGGYLERRLPHSTLQNRHMQDLRCCGQPSRGCRPLQFHVMNAMTEKDMRFGEPGGKSPHPHLWGQETFSRGSDI